LLYITSAWRFHSQLRCNFYITDLVRTPTRTGGHGQDRMSLKSGRKRNDLPLLLHSGNLRLMRREIGNQHVYFRCLLNRSDTKQTPRLGMANQVSPLCVSPEAVINDCYAPECSNEDTFACHGRDRTSVGGLCTTHTMSITAKTYHRIS